MTPIISLWPHTRLQWNCFRNGEECNGALGSVEVECIDIVVLDTMAMQMDFVQRGRHVLASRLPNGLQDNMFSLLWTIQLSMQEVIINRQTSSYHSRRLTRIRFLKMQRKWWGRCERGENVTYGFHTILIRAWCKMVFSFSFSHCLILNDCVQNAT